MTLKHIVAAGTLCVATMAALPATAMPIDNLAKASPATVENVHWACGRWRCGWRPNYYYSYGFYRPRVYVVPRHHRFYRHRFYRFHRW